MDIKVKLSWMSSWSKALTILVCVQTADITSQVMDLLSPPTKTIQATASCGPTRPFFLPFNRGGWISLNEQNQRTKIRRSTATAGITSEELTLPGFRLVGVV
ncbi:hypothetical protein MHYP_G00337980 [Metynnis hypsauchen]